MYELYNLQEHLTVQLCWGYHGWQCFWRFTL